MSQQSNRRRFLTALGAGSLAFAAGCTGQLPGGTEDEEDEEGEEGEEPESEAVPNDENGDDEGEICPATTE
jgi:hypothetical protein